MRVTINGSGAILTHGDSLSGGGVIEFPINEPPEFDDTLAAYTVTGSAPSRKLKFQGHEIAVETRRDGRAGAKHGCGRGRREHRRHGHRPRAALPARTTTRDGLRRRRRSQEHRHEPTLAARTSPGSRR
jgi:hypothetical protein